MIVTNSLIRVIHPRGPLPKTFQDIRPDLGLHVMELTCDRELADWELETVKTLELIKAQHVSGNELVLFVESSGDLPVRFSNKLLTALTQAGGELEYYCSSGD